ncbi:hypothetical protein EG328_006509 [Venturia inaequalis]|uniref:CFEM domain-containing protein n=1 Tax=Venturia inaequalis TaxID=5025 RepID=A0A8H3YS82_VENIN|nr:hypothetical protein EG328_006509 [Venturia inaequalis]RDI76851.1 hypothetical protein Vi05172_g13152 [Venturia inaequalis]
MRFPILLPILSFAILTYAQQACDAIAAELPSCARTCVGPAVLANLGCDSLEDYACLCQKGDLMQTLIKPCVVKNCGWSAVGVPKKAEALCRCVGEAGRGGEGKDEL